ncbi:MAG: hypothetical protein ABIN97_08720 [Ginsengibacter sp.]
MPSIKSLKLLIAVVSFFITDDVAHGQKTSIHIFTNRNYYKGKYKFTINGEALSLKAGNCMEYTASGDSVKVEITNKSLLKAQYPINLYIPAKQELYLYITWGEQVGKSSVGHKEVKEICKECYQELSKACKN